MKPQHFNNNKKSYFTEQRNKRGDDWAFRANYTEIKNSTMRVLQDLANGSFDIGKDSADMYYIGLDQVAKPLEDYCAGLSVFFEYMKNANEVVRIAVQNGLVSPLSVPDPICAATVAGISDNIFKLYKTAGILIAGYRETHHESYIVNLRQLCTEYRGYINLNKAFTQSDRSKV